MFSVHILFVSTANAQRYRYRPGDLTIKWVRMLELLRDVTVYIKRPMHAIVARCQLLVNALWLHLRFRK